MNQHSIELTRRYGKQGLTSFSLHVCRPYGRELTCSRAVSRLPCNGYVSSKTFLCAANGQNWSHADRMQMNKDAGFTVYKADGTANMSDETPWKTPDQGASTSVRAALDPSIAGHSGEYMDDCQLAPGNAADYAKDPVCLSIAGSLHGRWID